ncbi:MAG TPA: sensor domain-containing diguanylate cyclase [Methylocystis sp.]|nr:sensor domain-containing diguanylate cyclase [Methylocystis sp.]
MAGLSRELELLANDLTRREEQARQLLHVIEFVASGFRVEDVLNRMFEGFRGLVPFDRIGCAFISSDNSTLSAYWARSELGPIQISHGYSQPLRGSSLEQIVKTGRPRILNDLEGYLLEHPRSEATRSIVREGGRASLTCPLIVDRRPIGFLFFTSREKNTYSERHQEIFLQLANLVSIALDKSRVFEEVMRRNKQLLDESAKLEVAATHDALTGILNRGAILSALDRISSDASVGVIMADIDHFKAINDTAGHAAGDEALKEVARRLQAELRPTDLLGRYGGEEFLIVAPTAAEATLGETAERLRAALAAPPITLARGEARNLTASFGVAFSKNGSMAPRELIAMADSALYAAKGGGRNKVVIAGPDQSRRESPR